MEIGGGQDVTFNLNTSDTLVKVFDHLLMLTGDSMKEQGIKRDQLRLSHQDKELDEAAVLRDVVEKRVLLGCMVPSFVLTVEAIEVKEIVKVKAG